MLRFLIAYSSQALLGDIYAYEGKYVDAARVYVKAGQVSKAVDMYCNLRQFDKAREIIPENDTESAKFGLSVHVLLKFDVYNIGHG